MDDTLDKGPPTGHASASHGQRVGPAADHYHAFTFMACRTSTLACMTNNRMTGSCVVSAT